MYAHMYVRGYVYIHELSLHYFLLIFILCYAFQMNVFL
jgi:hypothetical protein